MSNPCSLFLRFVLGVSVIGGSVGCASIGSSSRTGTPRNAFIEYWPAPPNSGRLRLAVKDMIDVKGVVTSDGSEYVWKNTPPAARDAKCMAIARARGVDLVGKTNMSEFATAPSGLNRYFGTPKNPLSKTSNLVPGGSSSGSAVAVAAGLADVAFGSDTAGSVRVPAACCGVVGLKTTFGLVPLQGVHPVEQHLDSVGPLGKDIAHTVEGMDLLQSGFAGMYRNAVAARPTGKSIRVGRLYLDGTDPKIDQAVDESLRQAGFRVVRLDDRFKAAWTQAKSDGTAMAAAGTWISFHEYLDKLGVTTRTKAVLALGEITYHTTYPAALKAQAGWKKALRRVLGEVDFVALPTLQTLPPRIPPFLGSALFETVMLNSQNTVPANLAGVPALAVPIPMDDKRVPLTSLQLVGPPRSEAGLLNAGRLVEKAVNKRAAGQE